MPKMSRTILSMTLCVALLLARAAAESESERLLRVERRGIEKIVALTAQEHSTILFSIADDKVGYAKDGHLQWVSMTTGSPCNDFPALSHRGDKVLYQVAAEDHKCHLLIYDTTSQSSQQVLEKEGHALFGTSWSWDDSQITLFDPIGVVTITIESGGHYVALPLSELNQSGYSYASGPIQWLHDGSTLILTLEKFIPNAKHRDPRWTDGQTMSYIASAKDGHVHVLGSGSWPSVAPVGDEIAAYADGKLVVMTADGNQQRVVSKAPRYPRYLPLLPGYLGGRIVWSPDGGAAFLPEYGER